MLCGINADCCFGLESSPIYTSGICLHHTAQYNIVTSPVVYSRVVFALTLRLFLAHWAAFTALHFLAFEGRFLWKRINSWLPSFKIHWQLWHHTKAVYMCGIERTLHKILFSLFHISNWIWPRKSSAFQFNIQNFEFEFSRHLHYIAWHQFIQIALSGGVKKLHWYAFWATW